MMIFTDTIRSGGARLLRRAGDVALWLGALIGAGCLLLTLAGLVLGVQPLIFRSGSMAPAITAGSLGIAHRIPADQAKVGDIVSVPSQGIRVTHRVVAVHPDGDRTELQLKGDANRTPDARPYLVDHVDRLWFAVPVAGSAVAWLSRPPGVFVLAGYAAVMLVLLLRRGDRAESSHTDGPRARRSAGPDDDHDHTDDVDVDHDHGLGNDHGRRASARRALLMISSRPARAAGGVLLLGGAAVAPAAPAWAAFSDSVPVSGSSLQTYTVPTTTLNCGLLGVLSVTFNWTAVSGATSYTLHYGSNGSSTVTVTGTSSTVTTVISGGTAWVNVNRNFGSTTWTSANSNTRSYTVAVASLCA